MKRGLKMVLMTRFKHTPPFPPREGNPGWLPRKLLCSTIYVFTTNWRGSLTGKYTIL
jgi:hypothetical protein